MTILLLGLILLTVAGITRIIFKALASVVCYIFELAANLGLIVLIVFFFGFI